MNTDFETTFPRSWGWIVGASAGVSLVVCVGGTFVTLSSGGLLTVLFFGGALAGALSTRQAWLSGVLVGLPLALQQATRRSLLEFHDWATALSQPDYWRLLVPSCVVVTGVAILGGLSGAWLLGHWFRRR